MKTQPGMVVGLAVSRCLIASVVGKLHDVLLSVTYRGDLTTRLLFPQAFAALSRPFDTAAGNYGPIVTALPPHCHEHGGFDNSPAVVCLAFNR